MHQMGLESRVPVWSWSAGDPAATYLLTPLCSRLSLLDLVVAMAPYADEQSLGSLYSTIQPSLQVSRGAPSACFHPAAVLQDGGAG